MSSNSSYARRGVQESVVRRTTWGDGAVRGSTKCPPMDAFTDGRRGVVGVPSPLALRPKSHGEVLSPKYEVPSPTLETLTAEVIRPKNTLDILQRSPALLCMT